MRDSDSFIVITVLAHKHHKAGGVVAGFSGFCGTHEQDWVEKFLFLKFTWWNPFPEVTVVEGEWDEVVLRLEPPWMELVVLWEKHQRVH